MTGTEDRDRGSSFGKTGPKEQWVSRALVLRALPEVRLVFSIMNLRVLGDGRDRRAHVNKERRKHILIRDNNSRRKNSQKVNCAERKTGPDPGPRPYCGPALTKPHRATTP